MGGFIDWRIKMHPFTILFLFALATGLLLQWWLVYRQQIHVAAHRPVVPEAFQQQVTLEEHQKAADYTLAKISMSYWDLGFDAIILLAWTLGGGLAWLQNIWGGFQLSPLLTGVGFILSVILINGLISLPLSLWNTFGLETHFGFNRTTLKRYVLDLFLQSGLTIVLGVPLIWVLLWLMDHAGSYWWFYAWLVLTTFSLLMAWLFPVVIAPLFNKFVPLEDEALKERINQLLSRCGFQSKGVFVMDGSKRSGHGNAYFTGFGRNKRIVFFDTLLEGLSPEEVEAVLAHELGHFKKKHIRKHIITSSLSSLAGFALLGWLITQDWFFTSLGIGVTSSAAALLLFLFVTPVFSLFLSPISAYFMRKHEFEADDYAVEQTGGESLIHALVKLYKDNASTLTPDPLYAAFHYSHPPAPVRIANISTKIKT